MQGVVDSLVGVNLKELKMSVSSDTGLNMYKSTRNLCSIGHHFGPAAHCSCSSVFQTRKETSRSSPPIAIRSLRFGRRNEGFHLPHNCWTGWDKIFKNCSLHQGSGQAVVSTTPICALTVDDVERPPKPNQPARDKTVLQSLSQTLFRPPLHLARRTNALFPSDRCPSPSRTPTELGTVWLLFELQRPYGSDVDVIIQQLGRTKKLHTELWHRNDSAGFHF
ncbi:hypothetical protein BDN72DRAFT_473525 [Pluteus cervinus]|uniref:Uncharacterized protein n=1 Tax=Pluteus cervinus TaxID=181527 RepID=A0ACD3A690_9AGAR|nr:hypothetical protein BDN72DRAFT_473525 [Pluteus cervinus]